MEINEHTRIAELIKANSACIAAIGGLSKPLQKLANPLLRRVLAPRVTIAEAAAMGGCSVADFRSVLEPLGFTFVTGGTAPAPPAADGPAPRPAWLQQPGEQQAVYFDVRDIIGQGGDPLKEILARYKALPQGRLLCIINSFIPYPLMSLLEKKGAQCFAETLSPQLHHTWFYKAAGHDEAAPAGEAGGVHSHSAGSFGQLVAQYPESALQRLDVRHLPMPMPMQTILEALPGLQEKQALYVQHKRVPLHLLEALEDQPYTVHIYEAGEGDVRLLFTAV